MIALANDSYFWCPYGWLSSSGLPATAMAMSATTLPAPSVSEWIPSANMAVEPLIETPRRLRGRHEQVEDEYLPQDELDAACAVRQRSESCMSPR